MVRFALSLAFASAAFAAAPFAPIESWSAAVQRGDEAALRRLYSTDPPATAQMGRGTAVKLEDEIRYWATLKSAAITDVHPKVLSLNTASGRTNAIFRVEAVRGGKAVVAGMRQIWMEQGGTWRLVATGRGDFHDDPGRRLPQPATPNTHLYAPPEEAAAEVKAASAEAARDHKRVLLIFGANWCYDCHVLDTTLRSKDFAPLVESNFVVVHVNIGDEGKDNNDMAARVGVNLDRGVPSLAVLEPDGRVVVAQKSGEFESTVKIGPEDVRAFLEKWKPAR